MKRKFGSKEKFIATADQIKDAVTGKSINESIQDLNDKIDNVTVIKSVHGEIINTGGDPDVDVTIDEGNINFTFDNIKGEKGKDGQDGGIGPQGVPGDSAIFDSTTGNISMMKQAAGYDTLSPMSQNAVTTAINEVKVWEWIAINTTPVSGGSNYINANGSWASNSTSGCAFYPVTPGLSYKISSNASWHAFFVTSTSTSNNAETGIPDYAGGITTMPAWVSTTDPVIMIAPSDATHLYVRTKNGNNTITPTIQMEVPTKDKVEQLTDYVKVIDTAENIGTSLVTSVTNYSIVKDTGKPTSSSTNSPILSMTFNDNYDSIEVAGKATSTYKILAFLDSSGALISGYNGNGAVRTVRAKVPSNCHWIYWDTQSAVSGSSYCKIYVAGTKWAKNKYDGMLNQMTVVADDTTIQPVSGYTIYSNQVPSGKDPGAQTAASNYRLWKIPNNGYSTIEACAGAQSGFSVITYYSSEYISKDTYIKFNNGYAAGKVFRYKQTIPANCKLIVVSTSDTALSSSWFKVYSSNLLGTAQTMKDDSDFYLGKKNDIVSLNDPVNMPHKLTQMKGSGKLMLLHCSDIHYSSSSGYKGKNNYYRILQWWKNYSSYIDDAIATGDLVWNQFSDTFAYWNAKDDDEWHNPMLLSIGNHDTSSNGDNYGTSGADNDDIYNKFFAPNIDNWNLPTGGTIEGHEGTNLYYYKDYSKSKWEETVNNQTVTHIAGVRLIVINPYYKTEEIKEAQLQWLENVLADAKTNKMAVIIAEHVSFRGYNDSTTGERHAVNCTFSAIGSEGKDDSQGGLLRPFALKVENFIKADGEFICWLAGHHHRDSIYKYRYTTNSNESPWQLQVSIGGATAQQASGNSDIRVDGTKSQDLFNIISVSTARNILTIVRIGQDYDAFLRHKGTLVINYKTMEVLYND